MANTNSAKKAIRSSARKNSYNKETKNKYKLAKKTVRDALTKGEVSVAKEGLDNAYKQIDKAAKKGIIKKNTAARYKSRLTAAVKKAENN